MSKIVQAINVMLQCPENISTVTPSTALPQEFYFLYKDYKWSILYNETADEYNLYFYPGPVPLEDLATLVPPDTDTVASVRFGSKDIGTKEAYSSFQELYQTIKSKLYQVDEVLSDIIKDKEPF